MENLPKKKKPTDSSKEPKSEGFHLPKLAKAFGVNEDLVNQGLAFLDQRIDERIQKALETERPKVVEGLKKALTEMTAANPQTAQTPESPTLNPAPTQTPSPTVTPQGTQLLTSLLASLGGGGSSLDKIADTIVKARAISEAINPPSPYDDLMKRFLLTQMTANIKALATAGLIRKEVAESMGKEAEKIGK